MSGIQGQDFIDLMLKGLEREVKDHLHSVVLDNVMKELRETIDERINSILSEMVFKGHRADKRMQLTDEIRLLIEWSKGEKEYTIEEKVVRERVEK